MSQRSALLISAAITAFLLVLVGGLASRLSTAPELAAADAPSATAGAPPTAVIALDPTVEALIREREAAYQQALAEANSRLEQANAQIAQANTEISSLEQSRQQLAGQLSQAQAAPAPQPAAAPAAPPYAVSAERARDIALGVAPGAALAKAPELVSFEGRPAYEVSLDKGSVYVDAQSGEVLANGAAAPAFVSGEQAAQAAQAYLGGGSVERVDLEEEDGAQVYRVRFADGSRVYVDPLSGQVVYAEIRAGQHEDEHEEHDDD